MFDKELGSPTCSTHSCLPFLPTSKNDDERALEVRMRDNVIVGRDFFPVVDDRSSLVRRGRCGATGKRGRMLFAGFDRDLAHV